MQPPTAQPPDAIAGLGALENRASAPRSSLADQAPAARQVLSARREADAATAQQPLDVRQPGPRLPLVASAAVAMLRWSTTARFGVLPMNWGTPLGSLLPRQGDNYGGGNRGGG